MTHTLIRARLVLHSPFGTALAGDTLFGQLCWALRESAGEAALRKRLGAYGAGRPWVVVSDGFPAGYLPRPTLPSGFGPQAGTPEQRKVLKKMRWIPAQAALLQRPLQDLLEHAVDDATAYAQGKPQSCVQMHNRINRLTGTTGQEGFAPYGQRQTFYAAGQHIDLYLALENEQTLPEEVSALLQAIGQQGFGRDASIGLGKFTLQSLEPLTLNAHRQTNAWWTLAPCAPQGLGFDGDRSYWRVLTRFGRHGNLCALGDQPFKTPLLLAATGAIFTPASFQRDATCFIGQGLGGEGQLSKAEHATVHQGYAPALPVFMEPR